MAIIPLREYNREIEAMIDNGQLDEAVAHCRHILTTFPKHIASYRLLGKAHLEQQRISDATDIFQRVLSSIPDDFIANVGMSIIREDENNLDASIWHMELAFEAQPVNVAIQDELRRLYGRRDGMQPLKVRLTRGALARFYAKGGQIDLAIAELRAAISEDPNRTDLQLLLAQMYFQTSQRVEAVETCANILKKLPYCLEANRILAVSLPEAQGSETVRNYRQIVISMDPYYAFAAPEAITSDQVPDSAVNVERLEWKSGIQAAEAPPQPNWATSLGISIEKSAEENVPDWLQSANAPVPSQTSDKTTSGVSPFIWDTQEVENIITDSSKPEAEIPDWMKDAGWQPSLGEATQPPEELKSEEPAIEASESQELEKAEFPDWLQGIAPEGVLGEEKQAPPPAEGDLSTPWLEQHQPGPSDSIIQWLEDNKPETPKGRSAKVEAASELSEDEIPDWLKDMEPAQPQTVSTKGETPPATPAFTIEPSAFIEEPTPPESVEGSVSPGEISSQQPTAAPEEIQPLREGIVSPEVSAPAETGEDMLDEIPEWLRQLAGELPAPETMIPTEEAALAEVTQAAKQEPPTEEPISSAEVPSEELEAPLEEIQSEESTKAEELPVAEVPPAVEELPATEILPVSEELPVVEPPVIAEETPPETLPSAEEVLAPPEQPAAGEAFPVEEVSEAMEEGPQAEFPAETEQGSFVQVPIISEEQPSVEIPVQPEEVPVSELPPIPIEQPQPQPPQAEEVGLTLPEPVTPGEPEASEWLEGLVAEQTAKEEALPVPPEGSEIPPPEWVKLEAEPPMDETLEPEAKAPEAAVPPVEGIPAWIEGLGEEPEIQPPVEEPVEVPPPEAELPEPEELPAWLRELEESEPEKGEAELTEAGVEWKPDELPAWLKEITEAEPSTEAIATVETPTSEQIPSAVSEPASQWTVEGTPPAGIKKEALEFPPQEPVTVEPVMEEVEQPAQPVPQEVPAAAIPVSEQQVAPPPELPVSQPEVSLEAFQAVSKANQASLAAARNAMSLGQPAQAAELYNRLIKQNYHLDEIINDLQDGLYRFPVDVDMWVTLGDAYFRLDDLSEALSAYTKAEELLR